MMPLLLAAGDQAVDWQVTLFQQLLNGLTFGSLIALIALGYTMVYGIIGLINFAHGDLFMLGGFLAWTLVGWMDLEHQDPWMRAGGITLLLIVVPLFCAGLNWSVERIVYRPLRNAPKLAPLVSAIGVSFVFMNIGEFWGGESDRNFPALVTQRNLFELVSEHSAYYLSGESLMVIAVVAPLMIGLTLFVKRTQLGRAMRATSQDMVAAQLMGINVDRVIGAAFLIGGGLAGVASVVYGLYIHSVHFQMGYKNGLYAFTAAVLGGIGNIPGAVLGGLLIGMISALSRGYISEHWADAVIFAILILILVFKPSGLLGRPEREKV
jgi:branched-chain amino acid transport system permease protein